MAFINCEHHRHSTYHTTSHVSCGMYTQKLRWWHKRRCERLWCQRSEEESVQSRMEQQCGLQNRTDVGGGGGWKTLRLSQINWHHQPSKYVQKVDFQSNTLHHIPEDRTAQENKLIFHYIFMHNIRYFASSSAQNVTTYWTQFLLSNSSIFWNIMQCIWLEVNLSFGRTCHLFLQGWSINQTENGLFFEPEKGDDIFFQNANLLSKDSYSNTSHKTELFLTVRTSNPTQFMLWLGFNAVYSVADDHLCFRVTCCLKIQHATTGSLKK
jgi:hypothetical protein